MMFYKSFFVVTLCASSLAYHIDSITFTTPDPSNVAVAEQQESHSILQSELVAPEASRLSQFYQNNDSPHQQILQQPPTQHVPFLVMRPLIFMNPPDQSQQSVTKNSEKLTQSPRKNTYILYRPHIIENPEFVDMLPPLEIQDEPNYYALKPRKTKKYLELKNKKSVNSKEAESLKQKIKKTELEKINPSEQNLSVTTDSPINSHEVLISSKLINESETARVERDSDAQRRSSAEEKADDEDFVETSAPASRLDFQMHGHKGPASYKFGYNTGKGQFHTEEKDEKGNVYGRYGYMDRTGKQRVVRYTSLVNDGFKVL